MGTQKRYAGGIALVKEGDDRILPHMLKLREQEFFRYFAVDLLSSCTYFPTADAPCDMDRCEIEAADDVPDQLRERDEREHEFRLDGWVRWDMPGDFTEYYDVYVEPERHTGYDGSNVWNFIHDRIGFQEEVEEEMNAWKLDFNRAISGLHTSISAHICQSMELSDAERLTEFKRRIRDVPNAISNLHFAYMIQLCAIKESQRRLLDCSYMGARDEVLPCMQAITSDPLLVAPGVQEAAADMRAHAKSPNARIWKARLRTRDLLRVMNCVQCNVCRLHGKVGALGLATGLQVLLGTEGDGGDVDSLHRVEVAALITLAAKLSEAVHFVDEMERRCAEEQGATAAA